MTRFDTIYSRFVSEYPYTRRLRTYKTGAYPDAIVFHQGNPLIDFSSNDYLGLAKHPFLIARSHAFAKRWGTGTSSSRLVRGNLAIYDQLEDQLACALNKETALILGSGYQANASILEALLDPLILGTEPVVFCDKASHASIYAGLAHLPRFYRFRHNDLNHLRLLLDKHALPSQPQYIIAESIYSMEGDHADLSRLSSLAHQYQAALYIDDAHAVGVCGPGGWGLAVSHEIDIIMGTFSKALGSFGAYIGCSRALKEYLIHRCKGLIYSTALSPPVLGAISAAMELLPQLDEPRLRVKQYAQQLRQFFDEEGLAYGLADSHIVPWIIGSATKTRLAAQLLEEQGILAAPIQSPSVPASKNRIRFCLSALHNPEDLDHLFLALKEVIKRLQE